MQIYFIWRRQTFMDLCNHVSGLKVTVILAKNPEMKALDIHIIQLSMIFFRYICKYDGCFETIYQVY